MNEVVHGRAFRFGSEIDTDTIIPSQYMRLEPEDYAKHAMETIDPSFTENVDSGDMIVAESNFGIGSSREQAVIALQLSGIDAVIAESFARIFYRNAVNGGLPAIKLDHESIECIDEGNELELDLESGTVRNLTKEQTYEFEPFTEPVKSILEAGGAVEYHSDENNESNT